MYKKLAKDATVVFFAYEWSIYLVNRLVAFVVDAIFPRSLTTDLIINALGFVLAYLGAWFFFNQWNVKFWIKVAIAIGIVVVSYAAFLLIDVNSAANLTLPN